MTKNLQGNHAERSPRRLNDLKAGEDYLEPKYLPGNMPDHLPRFEFLKACERLDIPRDKWPEFGPEGVLLLDGPSQLPGTSPVVPRTMGMTTKPLVIHFEVSYDLCSDDHRTFKRKVGTILWSLCKQQTGSYLKQVTKVRAFGISSGFFRPRKQTREGKNLIPVDLRYELAARRYCLGTSWSQLFRICYGQYSQDRIRKSVATIISEVGIKARI